MANVKDVILDSDYDFVIKDGDFYINESDKQHVNLIIKTYVGQWKEFPLLGVGIDYYLASAGQQSILRGNIITQLISDSYDVTNIIFDITYQKFEVKTNAVRIPQITQAQ